MTSPGAHDVRRPHRRLAVRFGLALCLGTALILLATGVWNLSLQREHMTSLLEMTAGGTAETILRSTRTAMLENDPEGLYRILDTLGTTQGVERIRIFDKQGRIHASTDPSDLGTLVDKAAEQCYVCHRADRPLERLDRTDRVRVFERDDGASILGVITPIRNEPDCSSAACHAHPAERQVLGVLDVQLSLGPVEHQLLASERQMGIALVTTAGAVLALAWWLTWRMVLRPVRRLERGMLRVRAGDLSVHVRPASADEIGEMTGTWNDMVRELGSARDALQGWSRTLEHRVDEKTEALAEAHRRMLVVEKMASLGKLSAVVAHELNNPLAGIATYARLLARRAGEGGQGLLRDDTARILELVEHEARRCGDIVRNLLLFSRSQGARFADEDLPPLFERCVLLVRHKAELQDVTIATDIDPALPRVECDAAQVQQLLLALSMNAIEAMPDGGTLALGARRADDGVVLSVADTGCGIAPEHLDHVFEPFFTTKEDGKGVGLGLSVVYGIVERHRGRIEVDSLPGRGTTFRVHLPRTQPVDAAPRPADDAGATTRTTGSESESGTGTASTVAAGAATAADDAAAPAAARGPSPGTAPPRRTP